MADCPRLSDARLAELAAFCASMADTRREPQPWGDLAWVCEELFAVRQAMREVEEWYTALAPVIRSGDKVRLDRMLENGKRIGRRHGEDQV